MNLRQFVPTPAAIGKQTVLVVCSSVLAALILGNLPQSWRDALNARAR
jgi:hypothetical protein